MNPEELQESTQQVIKNMCRQVAYQAAGKCGSDHKGAVCIDCMQAGLLAVSSRSVKLFDEQYAKEFWRGVVTGFMIAMTVCFVALSLMGFGAK